MVSPELAAGARKNGRRGEEQGSKNSENSGNGNAEKQQQAADGESGKQNRDKTTSQEETTETGAESTDSASDKQARKDQRRADEEAASDESAGDGGRGVARRQRADANSSGDSSTTTDSSSAADEENTRRAKNLAQNRDRDEEQTADPTSEDPAAPAPITTTNPNVALDDLLRDAGVFDVGPLVETNSDVVANVSPGGGFAFARSGNIIAISGPDGATVINTEDPDFLVSTNTGRIFGEPSADGGNNDVDFTS
ncbi:MAG: hypothetical protein H0T18_05525 [Chloroflexia bacterium]|nr:hypothetical protein [Chloroflexia bacterium]